jgi:tRNA modification GTPase
MGEARTLRTAEVLLEQVKGALDRELSELREEIGKSARAGLSRLDRLLERARVGIRLATGWRVVIRGRPNVGKSRLLNALAGYARAIVDPTPGTTRDLVTVATALDGWPVELVDTAGVRTTDDAIERSGIDRALRQTEAADLVIKVLDRSEPLEDQDWRLIMSEQPALLVANKSDLLPAWDLADAVPGPRSILPVSAETGQGLDCLISAIVGSLVPIAPERESGVPFRPSQVAYLERIKGALRAGSPEQAARELDAWLGPGQPS